MRRVRPMLLAIVTVVGVGAAPPASRPAATQPSAATFAALKKGMTFDEATATMGPPSQVDDLQHGFAGLSPAEDDVLIGHRDALGKRAVWYMKKVGRLPNLNDVWFSAYFARDGGKLVRRMSNLPTAK